MINQSSPVELFTYALSPYGMKVYWTLVYKGIPFNLTYVSPRDQNEIGFTGQSVVPVLKIGDDWKLDSGPICCWLDEQFPEKPVNGSDDGERETIKAADQWVTQNIIGLAFRSIIDNETPFSAFRNGRKLANTMRSTSGGVPWWAQFIWLALLRRTAFVQNDASMVNRQISLPDCRSKILQELEEKLEPTGFVAGTQAPSYADIAIFAQLACCTTFEFEGALLATSSPRLTGWYTEMCGFMSMDDCPPLVPNWQPYGFGDLPRA